MHEMALAGILFRYDPLHSNPSTYLLLDGEALPKDIYHVFGCDRKVKNHENRKKAQKPRVKPPASAPICRCLASYCESVNHLHLDTLIRS